EAGADSDGQAGVGVEAFGDDDDVLDLDVRDCADGLADIGDQDLLADVDRPTRRPGLYGQRGSGGSQGAGEDAVGDLYPALVDVLAQRLRGLFEHGVLARRGGGLGSLRRWGHRHCAILTANVPRALCSWPLMTVGDVFRMSAISAYDSPSSSRSSQDARCRQGSSPKAAPSATHRSACWAWATGSVSGPAGKVRTQSSPTMGRRRRRALSTAFAVIRNSQVRSAESPRNCGRCTQAWVRASCTASSAWPMSSSSMCTAYRNIAAACRWKISANANRSPRAARRARSWSLTRLTGSGLSSPFPLCTVPPLSRCAPVGRSPSGRRPLLLTIRF